MRFGCRGSTMALRTSGCASGRCSSKGRSPRTSGKRQGACGWTSAKRAAPPCRRRSGRCYKRCIQRLEARAAVAELEQRLLDLERQGQQLGETRTHPGARIQVVRMLEQRRVLLDHPLEQPDAARARLRHRGVAFVFEKFDRGPREAV